MRSSILSERRTQQSKIVEGPLVNTQHVVTPTSNKRRTVYHTPAIIETVVEEDQPQPVVVRAPIVRNTPVSTVRRAASLAVSSPRPATIYPAQRIPPIQIVQNRTSQTVQRIPSLAPTARTGNDIYDSRDFGVKVKEDLSSIRPPTMHEQSAGCCHTMYVSSVACCRFFKCPFWICCLIPLLIILAFIGASHWRNTRFNKNTVTRNQTVTRRDQYVDPITVSPIEQKRALRKDQIVEPIVQPAGNGSNSEDGGLNVANDNDNKDERNGNKKKIIASRVTKVEEKIEDVTDSTEDTQNIQNKAKEESGDGDKSAPSTSGQQSKSESEGAKASDQSFNTTNPETESDSKSYAPSKSEQTTTTTESNSVSESQGLPQTQENASARTRRSRRTDVTRRQSSTKESGITSLFNSVLNFRLAPTFKESSKLKIHPEIHHHLRNAL